MPPQVYPLSLRTMGHRFLTFSFVAFALVLHPVPAHAWGYQGHKMIADIAMDHLTQEARQSLRELLGGNDLASISTCGPSRLGTAGPTPSRGATWTSRRRQMAIWAPAIARQATALSRRSILAAVLADPRQPVEVRQGALRFSGGSNFRSRPTSPFSSLLSPLKQAEYASSRN